MDLQYPIEVITFNPVEIMVKNSDKEYFELTWENDTHAWSINAWPWDNERNEYGSHEHMGQYRNLPQILETISLGRYAFYDMNEVDSCS